MSFRAFLSQTRASFAALTSPMIGARSSIKPSPPIAVPGQIRCASNLGPRRTKYRKAQKGRVPFPTGGSVKGTTVTQGIYGLRALDPSRITATQLTAAETALKRKLKVVRGSQVFMRVFPDIPFCVKGNETRMGKGKGSFEYWACRCVNCLSITYKLSAFLLDGSYLRSVVMWKYAQKWQKMVRRLTIV